MLAARWALPVTIPSTRRLIRRMGKADYRAVTQGWVLARPRPADRRAGASARQRARGRSDATTPPRRQIQTATGDDRSGATASGTPPRSRALGRRAYAPGAAGRLGTLRWGPVGPGRDGVN